MSGRVQNERKNDAWESLPNGGRRYWRNVAGRTGGRARYVKEVDDSEMTLRFWQEIFDDAGRLIEIHEKYPIDRGHQTV